MKVNKEKNVGVIGLLSFLSLLIIAILIAINVLYSIFGKSSEGVFVNILETLEKMFTMIVIGVFAHEFVSDKKKCWKIIYWISIVVFIAATVMIWFK